MKKNNEFKNDEIGSIGIGAMIVFIALILWQQSLPQLSSKPVRNYSKTHNRQVLILSKRFQERFQSTQYLCLTMQHLT